MVLSDPLENHKAVGYLRNTSMNPPGKSQNYPAGQYWHNSETPFKWRFAGGLKLVRFVHLVNGGFFLL